MRFRLPRLSRAVDVRALAAEGDLSYVRHRERLRPFNRVTPLRAGRRYERVEVRHRCLPR